MLTPPFPIITAAVLRLPHFSAAELEILQRAIPASMMA
jgi:hypothetical protein